MKKSTPNKPIDPAELSINNDPYTGRERTSEGKYDPIFRKAKQGQRIVCPEGRAGGIAHAYAKWLKKNVGAKQPIVRTKDRCDDGKAGVWWLGEKESKPAKTHWAGLQKAA
jgi:hypothetical protein